jgi:hypothetical protein
MIVALDPSSVVIGWAVLRPPEELCEAGLIQPAKHSQSPIDRIRSMLADLRELLGTIQGPEVPIDIVIEVTSGKVNAHRHGGRGAGLAVYGMAVGAAWQVCEDWAAAHQARVHAIPENQWARRVPKWKRSAAIASLFPRYDPAADPGGDMADAIGLACWFLRERTARAACTNKRSTLLEAVVK